MTLIRIKNFYNIKGTNYYSSQGENVYDIRGVESDEFYINGDILKSTIHFPNGSRASYVAKVIGFDWCEASLFDKYQNTNLEDKNKIEEQVKELSHILNVINEVKIENNVLTIDYEYAQNPNSSYEIALALFVNIPELEKVVITTKHKQVSPNYYGTNDLENIKYDFTVPLEITREIVNEKASRTIEEMQMILNKR